MNHDFSIRMQGLKGSPTLALNAKAKELSEQGTDILNFAVGEPDFDTPTPIVDTAIRALLAGRTRYSSPGGSLALRQAVAEKLARENGLHYEPSAIVCGIGAKELLFHAFLALLNEGDEVLLMAPYWVSYADQILAAGAKPVIIPPPEKGVHFFDPVRFERYASPRTKACVVCTPNNPVGYCISEAELAQFAPYLDQKGWWLISDEIYEYMSFSGPHRSLLTAYPPLQKKGLLISGLSKSFAMTGWRVGYAAGPKAWIDLIRTLQGHSSTCLPPFIEEAACTALKAGKELMEKEIAGLKAKRDLAVRCLDAIPHLRYTRPEGAFYVFIDLRPYLGPEKAWATSLDFSTNFLAEQHVAAVPGEAFGTPGFLRLSYACGEDTIREGIARLGAFLRTAPD